MKLLLLLDKDILNWSKVKVKSLIILQTYHVCKNIYFLQKSNSAAVFICDNTKNSAY